MKILITGTNGLLGQYLVRDSLKRGYEVVATGKRASQLSADTLGNASYLIADITDKDTITTTIINEKPDVVIHAAAMAQPDACELDKEAAHLTNVSATGYICDAASAVGARVVFVSTDFVFDGQAGPYNETDAPNPVNYYGQTKLDAEHLVQKTKDWTIVRTVLVYGNILSGTRSNIVTWAKDNLEAKKPMKVVSDQIRTPTYVEDLSEGIMLTVDQRATGLFHISGEEVLTPYEIALKVADYFKLDTSLMEKVDASIFTQPAVRPLKTGFDISKAKDQLGYKPVSFMEGIRKMFE